MGQSTIFHCYVSSPEGIGVFWTPTVSQSLCQAKPYWRLRFSLSMQAWYICIHRRYPKVLCSHKWLYHNLGQWDDDKPVKVEDSPKNKDVCNIKYSNQRDRKATSYSNSDTLLWYMTCYCSISAIATVCMTHLQMIKMMIYLLRKAISVIPEGTVEVPYLCFCPLPP